VGGTSRAVDTEAVRGTGGVISATWGAADVDEAVDDGAGGLTASLCSWGGLTTREHDLTASLCSQSGVTAQEHGLTASNAQRREP
jgi:hypothetical protein